MKAAISARTAIQDEGAVQRQIKQCLDEATSNGWSVEENHVFVDNGASGNEIIQRKGLVAMFTSVERVPPSFELVIVTEPSRLVRDFIFLTPVLDRLRIAGVRLYALNDPGRSSC
jgi:DNA invertase Pin-like site-specific DNA recombinase